MQKVVIVGGGGHVGLPSLSSQDWSMKKIKKWPNLKVHSFSEASWGQDAWILEKIDYRLSEY